MCDSLCPVTALTTNKFPQVTAQATSRGCVGVVVLFFTFIRLLRRLFINMNIFRLVGDLSHLLAIIILLVKMWTTRSCAGMLNLYTVTSAVEAMGKMRMRGWVSLKADRTTAHSDHCAVVRSDHANYDRRALIICR